MKKQRRQLCKGLLLGLCLVMLLTMLTACGGHRKNTSNLLPSDNGEKRIVNLFSPMEKTDPNAENVARSATDKTVIMAEEKLGVSVAYITYTAEDSRDKTYDDVSLNRARNNMDDLYLLNPDAIKKLGKEGFLADLSGLDNVQNLRDVVLEANVVDGKLVAVPQEVVAYGLFINKNIFDECKLSLPETPEEFLECCRVLKENGYETPVGANRWWLECFVLAQGFADLYNGGDTEAQIAALNSGELKYSELLRPGFEFLQEMIDKGYIDAEKALVSEAIEGEGADFLAQKTPIVMAYWGAANTKTAYGATDFEMVVIGFPSQRGQMPVMPMTGFGVGVNAEHLDDALKTLDVLISDEALQVYAETNRVISPSKNVAVECVPALKPLNDRIEENVYVLGSNASMNLEQWGNTCLVVRMLLAGATVDECMAEFDRLQAETIK